MSSHDVIVLGAGPAGLALAGGLAARGLGVCLVAPDPNARWLPNYGAWADELAGLDLAPAVSRTWASPLVHADGREHTLPRRYVKLDTPRLQALLHQRASAVSVVAGRAVALEPTRHGQQARLADGRTLAARLVVDATGEGHFVGRRWGGRPAVQAAYGQLLRVDAHPWDHGEMVLMDFRAASGRGASLPGDDEAADPTFLYALPLGRDLVFVEETSLARRPALPPAVLAARLSRRLVRMGIRRREMLEEEHCFIRMGGALPRLDQPTLGFGAAAGVVHPATGYQLARSLQAVAPVADAIAAALAAGTPAGPAGWDALWPRDRQRAWELYQFGLDAVCRMDAAQTGRFFSAFFQLPPEVWTGFLSGTLPPAAVARAMATLFGRVDAQLQLLLVGTGAGLPGTALLRSVVGA